jgi:hypothetical protein
MNTFTTDGRYGSPHVEFSFPAKTGGTLKVKLLDAVTGGVLSWASLRRVDVQLLVEFLLASGYGYGAEELKAVPPIAPSEARIKALEEAVRALQAASVK